LPLEAVIVALVVGISFFCYALMAWLFSLPSIRGLYARRRRRLERAVGALLIGSGLRLALER
jgi:threonine/homoserine/homoserine lactone efflux protein